MRAASVPYTYGNPDDGVLLWKMHGSVNWRSDTPAPFYPQRLHWRPVELRGVPNSGLLESDDLLRFRAWRNAEPIGGEVAPFLVLPGYGKAKDVNRIASLWYKPEGFFYWRGDVYIIGLSVSHDDFFVRSFLLDNLSEPGPQRRRVIVVNPDPGAKGNYEFVLNTPGGEFWQERFALAHLDHMKARK
jgi:hypothetical protein